MRVPHNHPAFLSQRAFGPETPSSTAAAQREARPGLLAFKDGFESTASSPGAHLRTAASVGGIVDEVGEDLGEVKEKAVGFLRRLRGLSGTASRPDLQHDGMMVGRWDQTFPVGTPLDQLPAVLPDTSTMSPRRVAQLEDPQAQKTILYVNGILTDLDDQGDEMQHIANETGSRVIGIHNSTEGAVRDIAESANDKLALVRDLAGITSAESKGSNPAVDTLAATMYSELKAGRDVHVMGYSQGALITARALRDVATRLRTEDGLPQDQVEQLMSRINVETFGGAGAIFPDGPRYVHYINTKDVVPMGFGLGNELSYPGRDAVVHKFQEGEWYEFRTTHDLDESYLTHRVPFEDARNGEFHRPRAPRTHR